MALNVTMVKWPFCMTASLSKLYVKSIIHNDKKLLITNQLFTKLEEVGFVYELAVVCI